MLLKTWIGRLSASLALSTLLALAACASPQGGGAGGQGSASQSGELSDLDKVVATCEGRDPFGLGDSLPIVPEKLCDFLVLGLADGFAAMGRNHPAGMFCVPSDFSVDDYRGQFVEGLSRTDLSKKRREDIMLAGVTSDGSEGADCGWTGEQTLGALGEDCRWFEIVTANDRESAVQDLFLRSGAYSLVALRRKAADGISNCSGYIVGYLAAGAVADRIDRDPAFCVEEYRDEDKGETVRRNDISARKLAQIATDLTAIKDSHPERTAEPAGEAIYRTMVEQFPCPSATKKS